MSDKRIFIGSFIQNEALTHLFEQSKQALDHKGRFKWTRTPDNFHITFHFIGAMPDADIEILQNLLDDLMQKDYDFGLEVSGLNFFKRKGRPSVLYAGIKPNERLFDLHQVIQKSLYKQGFISEMQSRFTPHITLARIKKAPIDFAEQINQINRNFQSQKLHPIRVTLIESILAPQGALYQKFV